jgi:hypothetical protein
MTRDYYDLDGFVYDPRFLSVFCDNIQTELAAYRGKLHILDYRLADHMHPANTPKVKPDALYRKNESVAIWKHDEDLYRQLKSEIR